MIPTTGRALDGHLDGDVDSHLDRTMPGQPGPVHINPDLALTLMSRIWSAGIEVAAIGALIGDGPLSERAAAIVNELDSVIRDIRAGVSMPHGPVGPFGPARPAAPDLAV